jgi:hypothetical protein
MNRGILNFVDKLKLAGLNTNFAAKTNYHVLVNADGTVSSGP